MFPRALGVALAIVAVTVGVTASQLLPAASESDRLGPRAIADVVALRHHDQQGVVLAHQAAAQSPDPATRARAVALASQFRRQELALTRVLDQARVPPRRRLVDTTALEVADADAVGCDLMPDDAVSRLAATPPEAFDARFSTLMRRHLVGGARMATSVLANDRLGRAHRAHLRAAQTRLS
jgi:hypothetical protein